MVDGNLLVCVQIARWESKVGGFGWLQFFG